MQKVNRSLDHMYTHKIDRYVELRLCDTDIARYDKVGISTTANTYQYAHAHTHIDRYVESPQCDTDLARYDKEAGDANVLHTLHRHITRMYIDVPDSKFIIHIYANNLYVCLYAVAGRTHTYIHTCIHTYAIICMCAFML